DYGSKIHIVSAPVYYHNYMMGELFASQLHHAIARVVFKGGAPDTVVYVGNKDVGQFMQQKVFAPGRTLTWNELTRFATGSDLSPAAFAKDFQGKWGLNCPPNQPETGRRSFQQFQRLQETRGLRRKCPARRSD